MGMHNTHVPVHGDRHQEEDTSTAIHSQHEQADVAESLSKDPVEPVHVVAGTERQSQDEQKVGHRQAEEQHRAALPGLQVEAEDPEGQTIAEDPQNDLCHQQRREDSAQQSSIKMALHVELCAVSLAASK